MQLRQFAAGLTAALILVAPVGANAWATEPTPAPTEAIAQVVPVDTESTEVVTEPKTIDPAPADTAKAEEPVVKPPDVKSTSDEATSATPADTESTEVTPKRDTPKSEDPKQGTEDQTAGTQPAPAPGLVRQAPVQASAPVQSAPLKVAADPVVTVTATATVVANITASQDGTAVSYSADYVALKETGEPVAFSLLASTDGGPEVLLGTAGVRMVNGQPVSGSVQGSMTVPEGAKSVTFTVVREFASGQAAPYTLNLVWPEPELKTVTPTAPSHQVVDGANNDVVTPPTITGVIYDCTAWTNGTKTCKASPAEGHTFPKDAQTTWTFTDKNTQPEELGNDEDQEESAKPRDPKDSVVVTPPASKPAKPVVAPASNSNKSDRRLPSGTGPSDYVAPSTLLAPILLSPVTPVAAGLVLFGAVAAGLVSRRRQ